MKVLLEIPDSKASSFVNVLNSISCLKVKQISESKELLLEEIKKP